MIFLVLQEVRIQGLNPKPKEPKPRNLTLALNPSPKILNPQTLNPEALIPSSLHPKPEGTLQFLQVCGLRGVFSARRIKRLISIYRLSGQGARR